MTEPTPDPAREALVDNRPEGARESDAHEAEHSAQAKLFDLRLVIGGLFAVYGVLLTGAGLLAGPEQNVKSLGINVNLWVGLGLLVVSAVFLTWRRLRPDSATPAPDTVD